MEIPLLINTKLLFNETGDYITGENTATEETEANESEFVLIGGKILNQKPVQYGPFVASSKTGITKALLDYELARNGFEHRVKWNSLISRGVNKSMVTGPLNGCPKRELLIRNHIWIQKSNKTNFIVL